MYTCLNRAMEALKLIRIPNGTEASTENSTNTPTENNGDVSQSWTTTTSPAVKFFDQLEIYPTDKTVHFKELHKKTGLPYSEMVCLLLTSCFRYRNSNVPAKIQCTDCLIL